jgi:hypothetical protein
MRRRPGYSPGGLNRPTGMFDEPLTIETYSQYREYCTRPVSLGNARIDYDKLNLKRHSRHSTAAVDKLDLTAPSRFTSSPIDK